MLNRLLYFGKIYAYFGKIYAKNVSNVAVCVVV